RTFFTSLGGNCRPLWESEGGSNLKYHSHHYVRKLFWSRLERLEKSNERRAYRGIFARLRTWHASESSFYYPNRIPACAFRSFFQEATYLILALCRRVIRSGYSRIGRAHV